MKKYICDACPECTLWDDDYGCQQEEKGGECPTLETPSINQNPVREILFRGKLVYNSVWVYGGIYKEPVDDIKNGLTYIITSSLSFAGNANIIIPETVGQFTGLLDKNGKKIFEGDIFVSDYFEDTKFVVVFEHGAFCGKSERTGIVPLGFANDCDETGCEDDDFYYPDDYSIHIKVVGNIHDQKEKK